MHWTRELLQTGPVRFVVCTIGLEMLAFGMVAPALPQLVSKLLGDEIALASWYVGVLVIIWAAMQFAVSPILGAVSDRFGRRPVILLSTLGLSLDHAVMALAPNVETLIVGRTISGVTSATLPTAYAYITDVSSPGDRGKAFGWLGAAFGTGMIVGPSLGGALAAFDPRLPFWAAAVLCFVAFLYGLSVLPESLAPEKRTAGMKWRAANPLGAMKLLSADRELRRLAVVDFLCRITHEVYRAVFVLYVLWRYSWSETGVGLALASVGVMSILVSGFVIPPAIRRLGERRCLMLGLVAGALGFVLFGAAPVDWLFLVAIVPNSLWGLSGATARSLMTRRVRPTEQGQLQGALASVGGIAMMIGPIVFSTAFALSVGPVYMVPGTAWYLAAIFLLVCMLLTPRSASEHAVATAPKGAADQTPFETTSDASV